MAIKPLGWVDRRTSGRKALPTAGHAAGMQQRNPEGPNL
jgi:hypothetical protein